MTLCAVLISSWSWCLSCACAVFTEWLLKCICVFRNTWLIVNCKDTHISINCKRFLSSCVRWSWRWRDGAWLAANVLSNAFVLFVSVLRKRGKLISFLRTFFTSRPARTQLRRTGIVRERVFGCDLGEHLLNTEHSCNVVFCCCGCL